jgi:predicted nucleic acid-binding protein
MTVVDASIVVRLLQDRPGDHKLHERFDQHRWVHAPTLLDAEITSAVRGLVLTSKPVTHISITRAEEMLDDLADLPLVRYPMQPHRKRALALRDSFTAYDAFYVALAEALHMPLLTDDRKYAKAVGHVAEIETWP